MTFRHTALVAVIGLVGAIVAAPVPAVAAPASKSPVGVGIVVPLSVPGGADGIISAEELEDYTSPTGLLTRELDALADTSVAIGIDPMIIASIRLLGTSAPESAVAWLAELDEVDNETFALTYADSDLTIGLQAGSKTVVAPTSFDFAIDPTLFAAATDPTPDPDSTPDPTIPVSPTLPTSDTLLEWDHSLGTVAWPRPGTVSKDDLPVLADAGYGTTILSAANVSRAGQNAAAAIVGDLGTVVTDDLLSALFATAIHAQTTEEWQQAVNQLAKGIGATPGRSSSSGASVLLALDRAGFGDATRLRETVNAIDSLNAADLIDFSELVDGPSSRATLVDSPQTAGRIKLVRSMLVAEKADAAFATVADTPVLITGERRIRLLGAMVPNWDRYEGTWGDEIAAFVTESRAIRRSVHVADSSDLIFGDRGFIPISVSNGLDQPVTVYISVRPLSPLLTVESESFELEIEPNSQRRAQIPAVARSNGSVELAVSISTRSDVLVGSTTFVRTSVQAGWETPVTAAFAVLIIGVFVFGIVRSIRRRRRAVIENEPSELPVVDLEDDE